jgi:hypothetical protein
MSANSIASADQREGAEMMEEGEESGHGGLARSSMGASYSIYIVV